ncbi:MAG TPA: PAS domain S-box protein, partial [Flavisolibacter sp.]|nr:PAS domain S-box protein [Flavisolibacter sp.]
MRYSFIKNNKAITAVCCFCLLLLVLLWTSLAEQLKSDREESIAAAVQLNDNLVVTLEQYAVRTIHNADAVLQLVSLEYDRTGDRMDVIGLLTAHAVQRDFFEGIVVTNERGDISNGDFTLAKDVQISNRHKVHFQYHLKNEKGGLYIGTPIQSLVFGKPMIPLSRRLNKADGSFAGVVTVMIKPATFTRFYAEADLRARDIISLVAPNGITYARRTGTRDSFGEDIIKSPLYTHLQKNRVGNYFARDAIHQVPTYFSYRKLLQYPMIATVGVSEKDVLAPYYERAKRDRIFTLIISFLVLLFSVLVCLVLLHRKRGLEQVKESELKYRSIFEKSHDAILLMQPGGLMIAVNSAACRVFEMPELRIKRSTWLQLVAKSDPNYTQLSEQGIIGETPKREVIFSKGNGASFIGEVSSSLYKDSEGAEKCLVLIRDITERKRMAEKLLVDEQRFQRKITKQVILAQEREREVIGRELHDNVNQVLTTVKLYLEMAKTSPETCDDLLSKSIHHIIYSINEIRNLSRDLSAPTLGTQSLIDSISALVEMVGSSSGIPIQFECDSYSDDLDKE